MRYKIIHATTVLDLEKDVNSFIDEKRRDKIIVNMGDMCCQNWIEHGEVYMGFYQTVFWYPL